MIGLCMCVLLCTHVHARVMCTSYVVCAHNECMYCVICVCHEYVAFTYIVVGMHACVYVCIGAMCAWICVYVYTHLHVCVCCAYVYIKYTCVHVL